MERTYTTKQVAEYFHVEPKTVTESFIPQGLEYIKVSKNRFIYLESKVIEFRDKKNSKVKEVKNIFRSNKRFIG
jgi:hypothetical protein